MNSILKVYRTYTEAINAYQKMEQEYPNDVSDITHLTIKFGGRVKIRFNYIDNLEGFSKHGYDSVEYDPELEDAVMTEFGVLDDSKG